LERRKRETEPRRVGFGEGGLYWFTYAQDRDMSERRGGLAERASGGGAARGGSRLVAGMGDVPLNR
jgi:hypothetical protein